MADQDDEVRVVDGVVDVVAIRDRRGAHVHLIPWTRAQTVLSFCAKAWPQHDVLPQSIHNLPEHSCAGHKARKDNLYQPCVSIWLDTNDASTWSRVPRGAHCCL